MREVNFSIPSANKASVGITTALYDRRALDTTSTLPLINSLNNLAYLTTSSIRIRDILTVDGGIERLVCLLKEGRNTKDMMELWKWNLAFQCIVNIGVRGSEAVRTRVVEADMVPVIATMLHNYVSVCDKIKDKTDYVVKRSRVGKHRHEHHHHHDHPEPVVERNRRQPPPPIEIPGSAAHLPTNNNSPQPSLSSPPERTTFTRRHHHQRSLQVQALGSPSRLNVALLQGNMADMEQDQLPLRPVRDIDRLPSMIPGLQAEFAQPESPTTPNGAPQLPPMLRGSPAPRLRRPAIRHQLSVSSQSDIMAEDTPQQTVDIDTTPDAGLQNELNMQDMEAEAIEGGGSPVRVEPPAAQTIDGVDNLDMPGSALESAVTPRPTNVGLSPTPNMQMPVPPAVSLNPYASFVQEASRNSPNLPSVPSEGDVLMCLQLLAYVSKYCNLRTYFQQTHLVPRLKLQNTDLAMLDPEAAQMEVDSDPDAMEEYLQPDDFNIFPLVEKFTVRHNTADMQYWARVVMRNLCRKDESRGGIRQCAYYKCGKWERFTREFAKCRRCRRTKYCSKECQKLAWVYHRHWCVEATQANSEERRP